MGKGGIRFSQRIVEKDFNWQEIQTVCCEILMNGLKPREVEKKWNEIYL